VRLGTVEVNDYIACVIRSKVIEIGGFEYITMGIVKSESAFDTNAVGDAGCSIGLLQLNTCGGQGSDYVNNKDALKDPWLNLSIGQPFIARAIWYATTQGWQGERFIREVARRSGHPGFVDLNDARLTKIYQDTIALITDGAGHLVAWPPHDPRLCGGPPAPPPPPPPIGSWTEGPVPTNATEAFSAIERHAGRIDELVDRFQSTI
jgi:hypothetical protein